MDRENAQTLQYIFSAIALLFLVLWFATVLLPIYPEGFEAENMFQSLSIILLSPYIFLIIGFLVGVEIFSNLKKQAQKQTQTQNQQQQQQQVITVNVPSPQKDQMSSDSIFCIECGFKNIETARFCKQCGSKIE